MKFAVLKSLPICIMIAFFLCDCGDKQETHSSISTSELNQTTIRLDTVNTEVQLPGTAEMVNILKNMADSANPEIHIYLNRKRARIIETQLGEEQNETEKTRLTFLLAKEQLRAGETLESIYAFQELVKKDTQMLGKIGVDLRQIYKWLGLAFLRLGEQENCLRYHNHRSCILPIDPKAHHQWSIGSEKAMEFYKVLLERNPDDYHSLWLYNIAAMTLGLYPDGIEESHKLNFEPETNNGEQLVFTDIADEAGVAVRGLSGGVCMDDFIGNGHLDLIVSSFGPQDQLKFFQNTGKGSFIDKTYEAGLSGITGGLNLIHADYDNDGHLDILVLRGGWWGSEGEIPNSLLRNKGDGTFEDVTIEAGLLDFVPSQTAVWVDVDNDGWLDLFVGNESKGQEINFASVPGRKDYPCQLFLNQRDGSFREMAAEAGIGLSAFVKGVATGDFNADGRPDIFVSVLGGNNKLYMNETQEKGSPKFREMGEQAGVQGPFYSFPVWIWDFDQDGLDDIFVSGYGSEESIPHVMGAYFSNARVEAILPKLYKNNGDDTFSDVSAEMGLDLPLFSMGCIFGDLNNDGYPDFYVGTGVPELDALIPSQFYVNKGGKGFYNATLSSGLGHLQKGHGIAMGDLDNDGNLDIYAVMGGAFEGDTYQNVLFQNSGTDNNWVKIGLRGDHANKFGIGAQIEVFVEYQDGEKMKFYKRVGTGGSFGSSPLTQHIGLGKNVKNISEIKVHWIDGNYSVDSFKDLVPNSMFELHQGNAEPIEVIQKRVEMGGGNSHSNH